MRVKISPNAQFVLWNVNNGPVDHNGTIEIPDQIIENKTVLLEYLTQSNINKKEVIKRSTS
jgi:hypothetical protein